MINIRIFIIITHGMNIEEVCDMSKVRITCLIVFFVIISVFLFSCAAPHNSAQGSVPGSNALIPFNEYDAEGIDQAVASEIKKDYYQKLINEKGEGVIKSANELSISSYLGNYNGCDIVYIYDGIAHTTAERPVQIAEYVILFGSSQILWAYKDHRFYTIKEAYDAGLITKDDVFAIGTKIGFSQETED